MTTLANHTVGTVQPMQKIKEILASADHKIAMFVDASEAYGKIAVSVNDMGIDLMSVSGHKIHGPQGSGFLYVRKGVDLAQLIHGIVRLDDLHTGGLSVANIAGMIRAIELIFADFEGHHSHLREISKYFWEQLQKKIPNIMLNGAGLEFRAPHNVNVSFDFIEGEAVMMMLDYFNVSVATGSACASQGLKPNYVLMALGRTHEQSHGSIKFTFTRYHTREDIDQLISKLEQVVSKLRKNSTLNPANKPDNQ